MNAVFGTKHVIERERAWAVDWVPENTNEIEAPLFAIVHLYMSAVGRHFFGVEENEIFENMKTAESIKSHFNP